MVDIKKAKRMLKISYYGVDLIQLIIGTALMAAGTAFFMLPNKLSTGGFSGIATIFYYLFNVNMGVTILILNIPLFVIACFKLGLNFLSKAIIGTVSLSIFIDLFIQFRSYN